TELLRAGANIDHTDVIGRTALKYAAIRGHTDTLTELLRAGANIDHASGHTDTVTELLRAGANIDHTDVIGGTALMWAAYRGH
ncbi:PREDICTED: ankyrin repeat domain-containing protein 50-like, partial [Priapulus caudatus]|uniref:Ankyrin repeat domain-containing protein 50-like n=1 Tax=Priapulus caudatus TaxID=37621 RepID=A0ABM1F857_PRICU